MFGWALCLACIVGYVSLMTPAGGTPHQWCTVCRGMAASVCACTFGCGWLLCGCTMPLSQPHCLIGACRVPLVSQPPHEGMISRLQVILSCYALICTVLRSCCSCSDTLLEKTYNRDSLTSIEIVFFNSGSMCCWASVSFVLACHALQLWGRSAHSSGIDRAW